MVKMIDPINITNYNRSVEGLEEVLLFWITAAGKNAITSSKNLNKFLLDVHRNLNQILFKPFWCIRKIGLNRLPDLLKNNGIGCYNNKAKSYWQIANSNLNLKKCSVEDLESIYGIGMKTSRCFIIHSRKNAKHAGLDTHILKFLKDSGVDCSSSTPSSKKEYLRLESIFLKKSENANLTPSDFDLLIWRVYSGRPANDEEVKFLKSLM